MLSVKLFSSLLVLRCSKKSPEKPMKVSIFYKLTNYMIGEMI